MTRRPSRGHRASLRPGGARAQRYPDRVPDDRGLTTDRLEAEREGQSDWLDARDQIDAAVQPDDPSLPQRRRLRTHGDLVYEVALSVEIGRRVEGRGGFLRRSHPSIWVADSRLFGFADPPADRRARALEVDGVLRTHQIQDAFRALPRTGPEGFAAVVVDVCDRRDRRDMGGLTLAQAESAGRIRYGPPLDVVFAASGTDPVLLSATAAVCAEASPGSRLPDELDRAAQRVAVNHVDLCVRDPYRAAAVERRWEAERVDLGLEVADPAGANFTAWFGRTRRVAEAHYAAGLDPVCEPLPREAVEGVLASDGSLRAAVQALGGSGADVHRTARAVHAGFAAVRRLESWMVDDATLSGVMTPVLEGVGLSWPPPDRGIVVDRYQVARGAADARPSGPVVETAPPPADLYAEGRPFAGARWPLDAATGLLLPAGEALAVHAWRVRGGLDDAVFVEEAAALQRGGSVGPGQAGVRVDSGRGGGSRVLFPAAAAGVDVAGAPQDLVSVDQIVQGLGAETLSVSACNHRRECADEPGEGSLQAVRRRRAGGPRPVQASGSAAAVARPRSHRGRAVAVDAGVQNRSTLKVDALDGHAPVADGSLAARGLPPRGADAVRRRAAQNPRRRRFGWQYRLDTRKSLIPKDARP